jgi:hypothetical protein
MSATLFAAATATPDELEKSLATTTQLLAFATSGATKWLLARACGDNLRFFAGCSEVVAGGDLDVVCTGGEESDFRPTAFGVADARRGGVGTPLSEGAFRPTAFGEADDMENASALARFGVPFVQLPLSPTFRDGDGTAKFLSLAVCAANLR